MNFINYDDGIVEKVAHRFLAGHGLQLFCGNSVVIDEPNSAVRILLFVPDKNGENLFPNFGLLVRCESCVIRLLDPLSEIGNPDILYAP